LLDLMALLEFGERVDQDLQEALGGVPVLGSVVRVELGHRERTRTSIADQRALNRAGFDGGSGVLLVSQDLVGLAGSVEPRFEFGGWRVVEVAV
jgi:hypothetical protein